ncbi:protein inscuteable homolog [Diabrotica virgifera virgifera]|uniref:Protein inscuteable homolog isoform X1 n=2 Tax=Diabrotica virgifera virgifera TaxID=50390 RepID=A0A6P7FXP7_DIAVI|nr:protein inscuteable homolog [Diabrotica virgifera virgifera]
MSSALKMSEFKRSPSKVWWGSETMEWREVSTSPGSQDSGFSDTETSPNLQQQNTKNTTSTPKKDSPSQRIPKDIFKELSSENAKQNLSCNVKEKTTPEKDNLVKRLVHSEKKLPPRSPRAERTSSLVRSEPVRKQRYTKNSPKVSRNLFISNSKLRTANQYAEEQAETHTYLNTSEEVTVDDSYSYKTETTQDTFEYTTKSLPPGSPGEDHSLDEKSKSAPAVLERIREDEGVTSFNSLSSDCESELECLFNGVESPKHTSTPKTDFSGNMRQRKEKLPLSLFLKYQQERVPPIPSDFYDVDNKSVEMWLKEARHNYEQECMTTLQCKSIVGELNQKVSHLAACTTTIVRGIISHSRCIEMEYNSLNSSDPKNINPLIQSLVGNISDFLKSHNHQLNLSILKLCDEAKTSKGDVALKLISVLFTHWQEARKEALTKEIKNLVNKLESPTSELDLRATITGITSIALRNEEVVEICTNADIVPILLILCEKCEGSSMRSLLLRALSTVCCSSSAVRQFEKFSGVQIIADTLEEYSRPETERSEAVALLAQVTAPWVEDNHSVKGLQDYSRKLVKSLTKFAANTKCCQNLLLCAAALANLSTMDSKAIKHMIHNNTAKFLMENIQSRGPAASIYLLEQMATLLANLSASDVARKQLTEMKAPTALLCFLKMNLNGEDVEKRLQQKSIIALSRLCGERGAAMQVVELGGVDKLVMMCREKEERFDSDAVLVAALATLRKIVDTCGSDVLSAQDAQELVEPKLLDSFLAYSSQNESYV